MLPPSTQLRLSRLLAYMVLPCLASMSVQAQDAVFVIDPEDTGPTIAPTVIINEVNASNLDGAESEDGKAEDWIELYNASGDTVDLTGWGLSNNDKNPFRWTFPVGATIDADEYIRVWASKEDRIDDLGELHTNFNVDHGGDEVVLTAPNLTDEGFVVDLVEPASTLPDTSWCRVQSGNPDSAFAHCTNPTIASANSGTFLAEMIEGVPEIAVQSGVYSSSVSTTVTGPAGTTLRYTTDGSLPDEGSAQVNGPITISSSGPLRVGAFEAGKLPSQSVTATYIIDNSGDYNNHRVILVTMTPSNARSYIGKSRSSGAGWIGNVILVDEDGTEGFNANAAMGDAGRIGSRGSQDTFPLAINFRDALGVSSVKYPIFSSKPDVDSFKKLRLRNSGLDADDAHVRDAFWQSFALDANVAAAAFEPVSLFVNGEYRGMMDLREREDETLIETTHDVDRDYVQYWTEGDSLNGDTTPEDFQAMEDFVADNDLSDPALYAQAAKMVDPEALANYFGNYTFHHEEDSMWRNDQAYRAPGLDDAWRLRPHDIETGGDGCCEYGFHGAFDSNVTRQYRNREFPNVLKEMLDNPGFRTLYIQSLADQLNTVFLPEVGSARLRTMTDPMDKYMVTHADFSRQITRISSWRSEVDTIDSFFRRRRPFFESAQEDYFDLNPRVPVSFAVNDSAMGSIDINTISTSEWANADGSFNGGYYEIGLPMTAVPNVGFEFVRWEGTVDSTQRSIEPTVSNGATYRAVFAPSDNTVAPVVQALANRTDETGDLISIDIEATDPRGYALTFDEKKLPKGLDIHPESGRIYGKLTRAGEFAVRILVDNGQEETESTFTWTVSPRNNRDVNLPAGTPPGIRIDGNGTGMVATYFDNEDLSGEPELTRVEVPAISVGSGTGAISGFGTSDWTIAWDGTLQSPVEGVHTLQALTLDNDGIRMFVDGELVIDQFEGDTTNDTVDVDFSLGELKQVRIEFIDLSSSASMAFNWKVPGESNFQPVPLGVMNTTPVDPPVEPPVEPPVPPVEPPVEPPVPPVEPPVEPPVPPVEPPVEPPVPPVEPPTESPITLGTSFVSPLASLDAVSNQIVPQSSADTTGGAYSNANGQTSYGETNFVSLSWEEEQVLGAFEVYWWDNNADVQVPTTAVVEYLSGDEWVGLGPIGVELDQFNRLEFPAVATKSIRVVMSSALNTGILEARAFGSDEVPVPPVTPGESVNVTSTAALSTSYISPWRRLDQMVNGTTHRSSLDRNGGAYGNWRGEEGFGQTESVTFSWAAPQAVNAIEVYWWNNPAAEILVPNVALAEYWDGGAWVELNNIGVELDQINRIEFAPVSTQRIRISMSSDLSTGILEAAVFASSDVVSPPPPTTPVGNPVNIANDASLSTSYISPWRRLREMTNGSTHRNSADRTGGAYGNWRGAEGFGQTESVTFSWNTAQVISTLEVYWWNNANAEILVPNTAELEYLDGDVWVSLGDIGVALDRYNRVDFAPVTTTGLRISMSSDLSTGILEAKVLGFDAE